MIFEKIKSTMQIFDKALNYIKKPAINSNLLLESEKHFRDLASNYYVKAYSQLSALNNHSNWLRKAEAKIYSQHGEDGVIMHIFSKVGTKSKKFIEFGFGDGKECNSANLSLNFGWSGLLMDCADDAVSKANQFYSKRFQSKKTRIAIKKEYITKENINNILTYNNFTNEVDLLSIDIDGNDYWIWKEINVTCPRLIVIEYNATFGSKLSVTVPYDPKFNRHKKHSSGWYHGASLKALEKLGKQKGYSLVGCESFGVNAFFVREDIATGKFKAASAKDAYFPHKRRQKKCSTKKQFEKIKNMTLISV